VCSSDNINKYSNIKLRNKKIGISTKDAVYYRLSYAQIGKTKEKIVSKCKLLNDTSLTRQSYDRKESNIPVKTYELLLQNIASYHDNFINPNNNNHLVKIGVDGCYNIDREYKVNLNLGLFDISNCVPLDISSFGYGFRGKEVTALINTINADKEKFKNVIFVCDRLYHHYELLHFLCSNNFKFIIRAKGDANNLNSLFCLKKGIKSRNLIEQIRPHVRIIKHKNVYNKTVAISKKKIITGEINVTVRADCVLITNLMDSELYTDSIILDIYKQRWNIEIYFKLLKKNFKFNNLVEKNENNQRKMYISEMIITYIMKLFEFNYRKVIEKPTNTIKKYNKNTKTYTNVIASVKINETLFIEGLFDDILYELIHGTLNYDYYIKFCKAYFKIDKRELNRKYPRISKSPYKKWHLKGLSELNNLLKIAKAIQEDTIDDLNSALKTIAKNIMNIKVTQYG
jgi:hypothetical protein